MSTALTPLNEIERMANAACKSGLFPAIRSPEAAMTLMMLCQAEGLHPITALRRYHIIQGTPALRTDAMLGDFMAKGGKVEWLETTAEKCKAIFTAPGLTRPVTVEWTMADAKRAGLAEKTTWKQYPRQLLRARVTSEGVRLAMPEVVVGIYSTEEVQDFDHGNGNGHAKDQDRPITVIENRTQAILAKVQDAEVVNGDMTPQLEASVQHTQLIEQVREAGRKAGYTEKHWGAVMKHYKLVGPLTKLSVEQAEDCLNRMAAKTLAESITKQIADACTEVELDKVAEAIKAAKDQLGDKADALEEKMLEKWGSVREGV